MPSLRYSVKLKKLAPFFQDAENWSMVESIATIKEQEFIYRTREARHKKDESEKRGEVVSQMHPHFRARLRMRPSNVVSRLDKRSNVGGWAHKEDLSSLKDFLDASREVVQHGHVALNMGLIRLGAASMHMDANKTEYFYPDTQKKMALRRITLAHKKGFLVANVIDAARKYRGEEITEVPLWISEFKKDMPKIKSLITLVMRESADFSEKPSALAKENISKFVHGVMTAIDKRNASEAPPVVDQNDPDMQRWLMLVKTEIAHRGKGMPSRAEVKNIILGVLKEDATSVKKEIARRDGRMPSRKGLDVIIRYFMGPDATPQPD